MSLDRDTLFIDGDEGFGLFEHGALGRHDPSGFADWFTLAP